MNANVISLATRRAVQPGGMVDLEKQDAVARLRQRVSAGTIVYVVLRFFNAESDWMVCDFYLIDGHRVGGITQDLSRALDRFDPHRDHGMQVARPKGRDTLRDLIDGSLSRLLFGERDMIGHQIIR